MTSGSIGRPQHFSLNNCDVETLELEDVFESGVTPDSEESDYACQMAKLSTICW